MINHHDIFICPSCGGGLDVVGDMIKCQVCHSGYQTENDIPLLFVPNSWNSTKKDVTEKVRSFYEQTPFPNYEALETAADLIRKAEKGHFAHMLDKQIPFNIKVLDVGCGTGQLSNFLSISNRFVFGVDMCLNSLKLAQNFKINNDLERAGFYQMNLFKPIFKEESFSLVICNGALHHTSAPFAGFQAISKLVKKGGYILIGLYNSYGRIANDIRSKIFRIFNDRFKFIDPRLRDKKMSELKKFTWFIDQYKNPHESKHTIGEVLEWFKQTGFEFISSVPRSNVFETALKNPRLFEPCSKGNPLSRIIAQINLLFTMGNEGGFFIMIGRRKN
ncbi:MAG: class I SAM-dependent methyltransferase [Bacteroidota bacterium]